MYSGVWRYTQNNQNIFADVSRDVENFARCFLSACRSGLAALSRARARIGLLASCSAPVTEQFAVGLGKYFTAVSGAATAVGSDVGKLSVAISATGWPGAGEIFRRHRPTRRSADTGRTMSRISLQPIAATDEYSYSTTREDIAMTFEEFMMVRNHMWRRDVAITDKIGPATTSAKPDRSLRTARTHWRSGDQAPRSVGCAGTCAVGAAGRSERCDESAGSDRDARRRLLE